MCAIVYLSGDNKPEAYLEPGQTTGMKFFGENS